MKQFIIALLLLSFGASAQQKQEYLKIDWPKEYNWKAAPSQANASQQLYEIIPGNETIDNWTIIGTMMALNGVKVSVDTAMGLMAE